MNIRDAVTVDGFSTKNIPGCILLDVTEPSSPVFRFEKRNVQGRDGFFHNENTGYDGYPMEYIFETKDRQGFVQLTNLLHPGRYAKVMVNTEAPLYREVLVKRFSVEEMGFGGDSEYRVTTIEVETQPFLRQEPITLNLTNGGTIHNPGAATRDFYLTVMGNTGLEGAEIRFQQGDTMNDAMKVRVVGKLTIDNERKNLYDSENKLMNSYRKQGFYFRLPSGNTTVTWQTGINSIALQVGWWYWA